MAKIPMEKETIKIGDAITVTFDRSTVGWVNQTFESPTTPNGYSYIGCITSTSSAHLFGITIRHSSQSGPVAATCYNDAVSSATAAVHIRPVYLANS